MLRQKRLRLKHQNCIKRNIKGKVNRYLPEEAWSSLSKGEKAATNKAKAKGNSKGKQFVKQPKKIAKKTKKSRM